MNHFLFKGKGVSVVVAANEIVIALDQSTSCCGASVWKGGALSEVGQFVPDSRLDAQERIHEITDWLRRNVEAAAQASDDVTVVLEDIQFQTGINGKRFAGGNSVSITTYKVLAQLQGAIINVCLDLGVDYAIIPPSHWKSVVGITSKYRKEQKMAAISFVIGEYGKIVNEDVADAVCIGHTYIKENA